MNDILEFSLVLFVSLSFSFLFVLGLFFVINRYVYDSITMETIITTDSAVFEVMNKCYLNGYEVDCNDYRLYNHSFIRTSGNFNKEPINKNRKEWIDVLNE